MAAAYVFDARAGPLNDRGWVTFQDRCIFAWRRAADDGNDEREKNEKLSHYIEAGSQFEKSKSGRNR